jgi:uridine kinase
VLKDRTRPRPATVLIARQISQGAAIDEIVRVVAARRNETVFIGIDGYGGSGKSTFAARVQQALPHATLIHIDDFAAPGIPEWDWDRFRAQVLLTLLAGRRGRYQRWDWHRNEGAEWHDVPTGGPVIVEGVSSTRHEVGAPWVVTVWVETPRDVRLERAVARDGEAMLPMWLDVWLPSEDAYVARENPTERVDFIVSGTEPVVGGR